MRSPASAPPPPRTSSPRSTRAPPGPPVRRARQGRHHRPGQPLARRHPRRGRHRSCPDQDLPGLLLQADRQAPVPVLRHPRHRPPTGLPARIPAADEPDAVLVHGHRQGLDAAAAPWKKAFMFGLGENATTICSLAAAYAAMVTGVPGGRVPPGAIRGRAPCTVAGSCHAGPGSGQAWGSARWCSHPGLRRPRFERGTFLLRGSLHGLTSMRPGHRPFRAPFE